MAHPILLYDGVCGLCNRLNQFVLRRDPQGIFRFASLQSPLTGRILARHGEDASDLDTVYVVLNYQLEKRCATEGASRHGEPEERLLARSDAVIFVLEQLGGVWALAARLAQLLPRWLRDGAYRVVARHRYRIFGRYETCLVPDAQNRERFLDV
jgi:predicted DCC family thiol-disulfide oxidoreductase YuxK